jgi:hypothetical protein
VKLADEKIHVRLKLAALWTSIMFCYVYGDFFSLYQPGKLSHLLAGRTPLGPTTQGMLVGFAIVVLIPSVMVFLSLVMPARLARWISIVLGVLYSLIMLAAAFGAWSYYVLLAAVEVVLSLAVVWLAWKWPREA